MYSFSIYMYMIGLVTFCMKRKHFLLMLLSLEFIVLSLYFNLMIYLSMYFYDFFFSMIFLTFSVCEGALGLAILISMVRSYGNDYFNLMNLLW
uniref:NADH-ubiquinone oxidoreductase chain 4L n=1 Tax=Sepedophilus bipunctatus TaxID=1143114 RepID=A0A0S2M896_9COLE|nr:NADH dehydrogenase subunit 4L [Sepedophilus bipunctatus]ALO70930.1 NADH deshydrogenase subunit 4L [Sepedophilus bipunctatus]